MGKKLVTLEWKHNVFDIRTQSKKKDKIYQFLLRELLGNSVQNLREKLILEIQLL